MTALQDALNYGLEEYEDDEEDFNRCEECGCEFDDCECDETIEHDEDCEDCAAADFGTGSAASRIV
jgi:hypothetical protein